MNRAQKGMTVNDPIITCNRCLIPKPREEFHKRSMSSSGVASRCKQCISEINKQPATLEHRTSYTKEWINRPENKGKKSSYAQVHYADPKNMATKLANNKVYNAFKRETDPLFVLRNGLRGRLASAIKCGTKGGSAVRDLGCSIEFLKQRLESLWTEGMSWDNYGNKKEQWNIDHKAPLSWFDLFDPEHVQLACHYHNLRPMWASKNVAKGTKIDWTLAGCRA